MNQPAKPPFHHLTLPIRLIIGLVIVADAAARPIYRPIINWIGSWRMIYAFEKAVARLPRLAILILFFVPFAVAEPLKIFALLLMASGKLVVGLPLLIFSYLITFLLVERIYHAGREKLLSFWLFAKAMWYISQMKDHMLKWKTNSVATIRKLIAKLDG